jgi:hypothetical protein
VTGSPCTTSGSQSEGVQYEGEESSRSQSVDTSLEVVTLGKRDLNSPLTTSGKRRTRWFQETLKEAKENLCRAPFSPKDCVTSRSRIDQETKSD